MTTLSRSDEARRLIAGYQEKRPIRTRKWPSFEISARHEGGERSYFLQGCVVLDTELPPSCAPKVSELLERAGLQDVVVEYIVTGQAYAQAGGTTSAALQEQS